MGAGATEEVRGLEAIRMAAGEAMRIPERMTVSQWADANRVLSPRISQEAGQWDTSRTPYLYGPQDAFSDPETERITLMFCTQVGKTEGLLNCMGYAIDQDPGPALFVLPTEGVVKNVSQGRLKFSFEDCPALAARLGGEKSDSQKFAYRFDRMTLLMAWSNSPSALSSNPIRYLFMDEVDKFPPWSGTEGSPPDLARERTKTYRASRKIVESSTPTKDYGYIYVAYMASDRCRYHVPCPRCGHYQVLCTQQIRRPEDVRDPKRIRDEQLAWYECVECRGRIEEHERMDVVSKGVWCPEACTVGPNGEILGEQPSKAHRGFQLHAANSPWVTFSDCLAEFLESKDYQEKLQNYTNSWEAEPWRETAAEAKEDRLRGLELEYDAGDVPEWALRLTAFADVQKDHVHYGIRAWGLNDRSMLVERKTIREWLPETGEVVSEWDQLWERVLARSFTKANGEVLTVRMLGVDSGYRTDEVYTFCRRDTTHIRATKGSNAPMPTPWMATKVDRDRMDGRVPEKHVKLLLWHLDTYYFKGKLFGWINALNGPWRLHHNTPHEHLREICAEHKVRERNKKTGAVQEIWVKRPGGGENHGLDIEVGNMAIHDMLPPLTEAVAWSGGGVVKSQKSELADGSIRDW